jgi:hypothetical protein
MLKGILQSIGLHDWGLEKQLQKSTGMGSRRASLEILGTSYSCQPQAVLSQCRDASYA